MCSPTGSSIKSGDTATDDAPLLLGWEDVNDAEGRLYWWNTSTNETTWKRPVAVKAKGKVAAGK